MRTTTISFVTKSYTTNTKSSRHIKQYLATVEEVSSDPQTLLEVKYRIEDILKENKIEEKGFISPAMANELLQKLGSADAYVSTDDEASTYLTKYKAMKMKTSRTIATILAIVILALAYAFLSSIIFLFASVGKSNATDYWTVFHLRYSANDLYLYSLRLISYLIPLPGIAVLTYKLIHVKCIPKYLIGIIIATVILALILLVSSFVTQ